MNRTFSIIKPDATKRNITGSINKIIEENGLTIVGQKRIKLSKNKAEGFYFIHKEKPFFNELVSFMISGPILVQVLQAENAINLYRDIMGSTNPEEAEVDTIRRKFGKNIQCNAVHGSDSLENAKIEISFFFSTLDLIN